MMSLSEPVSADSAPAARTVLSDMFRSMFRLKRTPTQTQELNACLSTLDLTSLGIGSILGAGTYVVAGQVAKSIAGPAVIISFTIAAFASLLSGLCYAEFGARVPKTTGSAYAYSYKTVGEFVAYIIGWNLVLEYMIGTAADARALSGSIDFLTGNAIQNWIVEHIGLVPFTHGYPDFLGFFVTLGITVVLAIGVKSSANYTLLFNVLNIILILFIIVAGLFYVDTSNWDSVDKFFPYGAHGVFSGAASCFYAYVGFDIIATTGAEAKTPSRSIPIAVVVTLIVCYLAYIGVSVVTTLIVPVTSLISDAPLAESFEKIGVHWAKYVVGMGAVFGLASSLLGSMFPLPRIIYAMAEDGLLFRYFTRVSPRTETPVNATVLPGVMTAVFTMLFELGELVEMMSIGTLLAYSLVCLSVLILRYRECHDILDAKPELNGTRSENNDHEELVSELAPISGPVPTAESSRRVVICASVLPVIFLIFSLISTYTVLSTWTLFVLSVLAGVILVCCIVISRQPQDSATMRRLSFKVPLVPWLPLTAVFINVSLMVRLSHITWIRFIVWLGIGLLLYFCYGIHHASPDLDGEHELLLVDAKDGTKEPNDKTDTAS